VGSPQRFPRMQQQETGPVSVVALHGLLAVTTVAPVPLTVLKVGGS
jgi:hypothetical protein